MYNTLSGGGDYNNTCSYVVRSMYVGGTIEL